VGEVEIGTPLDDLAGGLSRAGEPFRAARLLVRLHRHPVGFVDIELGRDGSAPASDVAAQIWNTLRDPIVRHLANDGIDVPAELGPGGLEGGPCVADQTRTPRQPHVTIVIATHNRPHQVLQTVDRALALDYPSFDVVIVDSAPRSPAAFENIRARFGDDPRVTYVFEAVPGVSRARNRGLREARGELVGFVSDDIYLDSTWLQAMVRGFNRCPDVACVTGIVPMAELETPAQLMFDQAMAWGTAWGLEPKLYDLNGHRDPSPIFPYKLSAYGTGAHCVFDVAWLRASGGFDERLGAGTPAAGGEDLDAFVRVVTSGRTLGFEPAAIGWHADAWEPDEFRRHMYVYGMGLTAFLTKQFISGGSWEMLRRAPHGVGLVLTAPWKASSAPSAGVPRSLSFANLRGKLAGPYAYVKSCWQGALRG
jgi:GT2 family glycosyltransferase